MGRSGGWILALLAGIEPIILGIVLDIQWLIPLGLGNLLLILLWVKFAHRGESEKHYSESKSFASVYGQIAKDKYYTAKKKQSYLAIFALLALIGGVVVYFLLPYTLFQNIAGGLVGAGIVYWILAPLFHGFKKAWKSSFGKLFLILMLLGVGRWMLGDPDNAEKRLSGSVLAPTTGTVISGTNATGNTLPEVTTGSTTTGATITGENTTPTEVENNIEPEPYTEIPDGPLTFADVVPIIVQKYNLPTNGRDVTFTNISRTNELYPYFKAGYHDRFFGSSINPNTQVSCNVYFVMLGLAQNRPVSYNANNVFSVFSQEATSRGQDFGCKPGATVTKDNLPG